MAFPVAAAGLAASAAGGLAGSLLGGGKSKTQSDTRISIIPRLPPVIPNISTAAGSFFRAIPTFETSTDPVGQIRERGTDFKFSNENALIGLETEIGLAPEIAAIRDETLTGRRALLGDVQSDIQTLRALENPFVQARVQPFVAAQERARQDAIRRGVAGPLTALATNPFTAQIAEQGALAIAESQAAIRETEQLARGLLSDISGQGEQFFREELALLGFSGEMINLIISSQLERPTTAATSSSGTETGGANLQGLGGLLAGIGVLLGGKGG